MNRLLALVCFGIASAISLPLNAGYVYTLEVSGKDAAKPHRIQMAVEGMNLKIDSSDMSGSMIFNGADRTLLMLDSKKKEYFEVDEKVMAEISDALADARAKMEQALENVPDSQRAMMKRMMPKLPEPQGASDYKIETTGDTETVDGHKADKVVVTVDGEKVSEAWLAPIKEIDGAKEFLGATQRFSSFFSEMMNKMVGTDRMQQPFAQMVAQMAQMQGFPIMSKAYEKGKLVSTSKLVDVEKKDLGDSAFSAPSGYKERKIELPTR